MNNIKVIKALPQFGLNVGDVLKYNNEDDTFDFMESDETINEEYSVITNRSISIDYDTLKDYFDVNVLLMYDSTTPEIEISEGFDYIKPYAIKAFNVSTAGTIEFQGKEYTLNIGDKIVKGLDGSMIPITIEVFNKLFKIIK